MRLHAGPFTDGLYTVSLDDFVVSASPIASVPVGAKVLAKPAIPAPQQQGNFCTGKGYKAGCTITSYYYFNGQRVAMRVQSDANPTGVVTWLHSDMLGSASVATDAGGNKIAGSDTRYMPFGEARSGFTGSGLPTDRRYTGQISVAGGLIDMNARALDPLLGRFISADTIVPSPNNPQEFNRYSYARNSPIMLIDMDGHAPKDLFKEGLKKTLKTSSIWMNMMKLAPKDFLDARINFEFRSGFPAGASGVKNSAGIYLILLPDRFSGMTVFSTDDAAFVAHEVFHAFQREMASLNGGPTDARNSAAITGGQKPFPFFSNYAFEREAYLFQYSVYAETVGIKKFRNDPAYQAQRDALTALQGSQADAESWIQAQSKSSGAPFNYAVFDYFFPDTARSGQSWEALMTNFNYKFNKASLNLMCQAGGKTPCP